MLDDTAETWLTGTRDLRSVLGTLYDQGRRHVLLEGGPTLAGAFLPAGLVDEVVAYVAPVLLGDGLSSVAGLPVTTIAEALRLDVVDVATLGEAPDLDVRLTLRPRRPHPTQQEG